MNLKVKTISNIGGEVKAPPSKSYSHRAVILASLADGTSMICFFHRMFCHPLMHAEL